MANPVLNKQDVFALEQLAAEKRRAFDIGMQPVGENIFKLIRKEGIYLMYLPIEIEPTTQQPFSAMYVSLCEGERKISFIGLNTADYYDKQIFALAHELYHHYHNDETHLCRISDEESQLYELKANRFAAEFLLPTEKLQDELKEVNGGDVGLTGWKQPALLRLIARLHCEYRLPYRAIVRRFKEIDAIDEEQFVSLEAMPARDETSVYYQIGCTMKPEIFKALNKKTQLTGTDGDNLETMIRNYEEGIISLSELDDSLDLFQKTLHDFGLADEVDEDDVAEFQDFLED